jgi:hypothetical protein
MTFMVLVVIGGFGTLVLSYVLTSIYMRRRIGIQPNYIGLLIMCTSMACFLLAFYVLRRFGLDLLRGHPRDIFWVVLGLVWLVQAVWAGHQRQSSGEILMDLGPSPIFKLQLALAILMAALAIGLAIAPESRAQAFAYMTWSAWFFQMARGRFEVRNGGVIIGGLLPWNRITQCAATGDNAVRLNLSRGLRRTVDLKLPVERRDGFVELVNGRLGR